MTDADVARRNGWQVGTRLAGDGGYGETMIEITAIGESNVLAKTISQRGQHIAAGRESLWTFSYRDWREVAECLHENTYEPKRIANGVGQLIREKPERCADCGAKRTEGGWR